MTTLTVPNSPIFPSKSFTSDEVIGLPENQVSSAGGVSLSIVLAEQVLFLRGFSANEYTDRAPAILRGSLVVRVTKATKIKSITLSFKGTARTEWPEGIPPKRAETYESAELHNHVWPFFNASFPMAEYSSGAHLVRYSKTGQPELERSRERSGSADSRSLKGLAGRIKRAASPNPSTPHTNHTLSNLRINLGPHRSYSKSEVHEQDVAEKGYRVFEPGDYIYNFELAMPHSMPETIEANFGSVTYFLEANIERPGTFKTRVHGTKQVVIVRANSEDNTEASEPIAISKDWDNKLQYEIVIGGKMFPIGKTITMAFKFTPLDKIQCHRVRVYVTENSEYFCKKKKVHRVEPTKKFLLKEQLPDEGISGSLLVDNVGDEVISATELEYDVEIPCTFPHRRDRLHPNTGYENIQIHHWIKVMLRLSKTDPENPEKRKFFEVSIDSPITLLDNRCTVANLSLPEYMPSRRLSLARTASSSTFLAVPVTPGMNIQDPNAFPEQRPIHFLRKPSVAPPPFDADTSPPNFAEPPNYDQVLEEEERGRRRSNGQAAARSNSDASTNTTVTFNSNFSLNGISRINSASFSTMSSLDSHATNVSNTSGQTDSSGESTEGPTDPTNRPEVLNGHATEPANGHVNGHVNGNSDGYFSRAQTVRNQSITSVDLVDQMSAFNLDHSSSMSQSMPPPVEEAEDDEDDEGGDIGSRPLGISSHPRGEPDSYPLLSRTISMKDGNELTPMDSAGDLGLGSDFDDGASLQSTPSLWIN